MFSSSRIILLTPLAREFGMTVLALVVHDLMASYACLPAPVTQNMLMRALSLLVLLELCLVDIFSTFVDAGGPG